MNAPTIDYDTMRVNCIQIHHETHLLMEISKRIGKDLNLIVKTADELRTHEKTKSWDGMGRFAKSLYDNSEMWDMLPSTIKIEGGVWEKEKSKNEFLDCYQNLGGKNLDIKEETDLFGNKNK